MEPQPQITVSPVIFKFAVSRSEAAVLLDISTGTFDDWIRRGIMPNGIKVGALRRWDVTEILNSWRILMEQKRKEDDENDENPFDDIIG